MKRRGHALRIGAFLVGGLALLVAALVVVLGGGLFSRHDRALMRFDGSVYGLQVGAPVVLRGVRLGSVVSIGLNHDADSGRVSIPVVAELDRGLIGELEAAAGGNARPLDLRTLVQRGLAAQLATQSLLTGQLYVDLDLRPGAVARGAAAPGAAASAPARGVFEGEAPVEIPTVPGAFQSLQDQLATVDLARLVQDVAGLAAAAKAVVGAPELRQAIGELAQAGGELRRLIARLDKRIDPLASSAEATLADTRRTLGQIGRATAQVDGVAARVGGAAERLGQAGERIGALADKSERVVSGAPATLAAVQQAADELARAATALRQATGEDAALVQRTDRAVQDLSRAARAVRDLAEQLQRQPDALLRGRQTTP